MSSENKLQIVEGGYYKNRRGEKVGPMKPNKNAKQQPDKYPWVAATKYDNDFYKNNGEWHWQDGEESQYDLIAPWTAAPAAAQEASVDEPGEGYRWVEKREGIEKGDQRKVNGLWVETEFWGPNIHASDEEIFRRRIAPAPVKSVPSVDVVRHEVNELRKANAELLKENCEMRDELKMYKELHRQALRCVDQVFQEGEDGQPAILPNYCKLGHNKFQAVITLADEFVELKAELDRHKESIGFALQNNEKLKEELRKEQQRCDYYKAESEMLNRSLKNVSEGNLELDAKVVILTAERDKLAGEVDELKSQLTKERILSQQYLESANAYLAQLREPPAAEYAWRDARPEDVGRKYKAQVKDRVEQDWSVLGRILVGHDPGHSFPWTTDKNGTECTWKFCQVYAPVEPPAAPAEVWRELDDKENYNGKGQVRMHTEDEWRDAWIVGTEAPGSKNRFVARVNEGLFATSCCWRFARIKESAVSK